MEATNETTPIDYDVFRRPVQFVLLLIVGIPAIVSAILILIFIYLNWYSVMVKNLYHHATFLLLLVAFVYITLDLPFTLNYFRLGYHWYRSIPFCLWWYWFDYCLLAMNLCLTATASVQRHILIYNSLWLNATKNRWIIHYIPLIISIIYPLIFYTIFMFAYRCTVYFDYSDGWCAYPCYIDHAVLYNIDWICNTITPVLIIVLANVALIIRTFRSMKKVRQQHHRTWQRQKKLTLQLLAFSSVYVIIYLPTTTMAILRKLVFPNLYDERSKVYYIFHMIYFVAPLQIFMCIFAIPDLRTFIKRKVNQVLIGPTNDLVVAVQPTSLICQSGDISHFNDI